MALQPGSLEARTLTCSIRGASASCLGALSIRAAAMGPARCLLIVPALGAKAPETLAAALVRRDVAEACTLLVRRRRVRLYGQGVPRPDEGRLWGAGRQHLHGEGILRLHRRRALRRSRRELHLRQASRGVP